jgi:high-affinity iron transporter
MAASPDTRARRLAPAAIALAAAGVLVWQIATARGGTADPTEAQHLSHGAVIADSAVLVFREGLECILVLAAVTASFLGANRAFRRPVAAGAGAGAVASLATWFVAVAVLGAVGGAGLDVQAATGLLAVVVLLVVMNWFFHRIYWTGWISSHHRRRRRLLEQAGTTGRARTRLLAGLALLGFSSVYREGFEVVLFLQSLRLKYGAGVVAQGAGLGLLATLAVGVVTFGLAHKLPYKRMLVATGVLLGVVLVVMVGESVQELQLAGWLPTTAVPMGIPGWMGLWLAVFPTVESLAAQALAAALVIGSYVVAEEIRVKRPRRAGFAAEVAG